MFDSLKSALAIDLVGKQVWVTHWWTSPFVWEELPCPQVKKVLYASFHHTGVLLLHFKGCSMRIEEFGKSIFNTKEEAEKLGMKG